MLSPKLLVLDTYKLAKVGMYADAAKWLGFGLYNWMAHLPAILFLVIAIIAVLSEWLVNLIRASRIGAFYTKLDDKEYRWRDKLREAYLSKTTTHTTKENDNG